MDQEDNRRILRDLLGNAGYKLIEAESGEEALAAVDTQHPDLILMDIQLPAMDGYEAARRIKSNPDMKAVPIIAVTSYALAEMRPRQKRRAAMPTFLSLSVHARCWRKCESIWLSREAFCWLRLGVQRSRAKRKRQSPRSWKSAAYIASATIKLLGSTSGLRSSFRHPVCFNHSSASTSL